MRAHASIDHNDFSNENLCLLSTMQLRIAKVGVLLENLVNNGLNTDLGNTYIAFHYYRYRIIACPCGMQHRNRERALVSSIGRLLCHLPLSMNHTTQRHYYYLSLI